MRSLWRAPANPLALWWTVLAAVSCANIALWLVMYRTVSDVAAPQGAGDVQVMLLLCAAYVFGCAFRSFLPRADLQRICLFDTWLSSVVVGRSVATVAELAFAVQWALLLTRMGELAGSPAVLVIALMIVPLIVTAEIVSWYGVVTTNPLAHAVENSIWAAAFLLAGLALGRMLPEFDGAMQLALVIGITGIAGYLVFLIAIDVPMYVSRWRAEHRQNARRLSPREGWRDVCTRWIVTHDIAHWKGEVAWMTLYFSVAVWGSLAMSVFYLALMASPALSQ